MCRSASAAAVVASLLIAGSANAQDSGAIARQRALVDSLVPQWQAVQRQLDRADSVDRSRREGRVIAVDTAVIGPFLVIAPDDQSSEHFRNFRRAVSGRAAILNTFASGQTHLFVERDDGRRGLRFQAQRADGIHIRIFGNSSRVRERFTGYAVDNSLFHYLPASMQTWLGSSELSRGRQRASVYREMATSPAAAVRACHRAAVESCIAALGLAQASDSAAFSAAARASLLLHALSAGARSGTGALPGADASAAAALERVSGRSLTQLVAEWRSEMARDYVSHAGLSRASAAALLWTIVALGLALRSTRRRAE